MMNFGSHFSKAIRILEKKKTDDKPYKLTVVPTLHDMISHALVGAFDVEEARKLSVPADALNALIALNSGHYFESGDVLRLRVSPSGAMTLEIQHTVSDKSNFNRKLENNLTLSYSTHKQSNIVTDLLRPILKYFPNIVISYNKTCLQGLKEHNIGRVGDMENDSVKYLELCYAMDHQINWAQSQPIDYLVSRGSIPLVGVIAFLDDADSLRTRMAAKLDDKVGVPHKRLQHGLFTNTDGVFSLGSQFINVKNDRDVTLRFICRVFETRTVRSMVTVNNYLDDDEVAYAPVTSSEVPTNRSDLNLSAPNNSILTSAPSSSSKPKDEESDPEA